jgi:urea-proton symporter
MALSSAWAFVFAFGMILITWELKRWALARSGSWRYEIKLTRFRYQNEVQTIEMFSTAGRNVNSGLIATAVVSSWTWAATLLQSSGVAYQYGVSGPFWVI